jgi:hypothetical protein
VAGMTLYYARRSKMAVVTVIHKMINVL